MIATSAQQTIKSKWLLSRNASRWLEAFQEASDHLELKNTDRPSFFGLIKSLSHQITQEQLYKNNQIDKLKDRVQNLHAASRGTWLFASLHKDQSLLENTEGPVPDPCIGLFNEKWYLAHNPDIVRAEVDPMLHFLRHGGLERRNPGPAFFEWLVFGQL